MLIMPALISIGQNTIGFKCKHSLSKISSNSFRFLYDRSEKIILPLSNKIHFTSSISE